MNDFHSVESIVKIDKHFTKLQKHVENGISDIANYILCFRNELINNNYDTSYSVNFEWLNDIVKYLQIAKLINNENAIYQMGHVLENLKLLEDTLHNILKNKEEEDIIDEFQKELIDERWRLCSDTLWDIKSFLIDNDLDYWKPSYMC